MKEEEGMESRARTDGLREVLSEDERHELTCLRHRVQQLDYPCSPHCDGYLRELALRNASWQPMETAPLGERVLVNFKGFGAIVAYREAPDPVRWIRYLGFGKSAFWPSVHADYATHWRPLPPSPETERDKSRDQDKALPLVEGDISSRESSSSASGQGG
jgi:hypothetical protein